MKRLLPFTLLVLAALGGHLAAQSRAVPENSDVVFVSMASGLALDIWQGKTADRSWFIQYRCRGQSNQLLRLIPSGEDGFYFIESQKSKKLLDVGPDGSLVINTANGGDSQKWRPVPGPDGSWTVLSKLSGKAIAVKDGDLKASARIVLAQPDGSASQRWRIHSFNPNDAADAKLIREAIASCEYDRALSLYRSLLQKDTDMDGEEVTGAAGHAGYLLLLGALASGDPAASRRALSALEDIIARNGHVRDLHERTYYLPFLRSLVEAQERNRGVKPQYTMRVLVLMVRRAAFHGSHPNGDPVDVKGEMTDRDRTLARLTTGVLKPYVEAISDGALSMEVDAVDVDATFTRFHVAAKGKQINPDFSSLDPYPSELLYDRVAVKNADVIIWTYPNNVRTMSWGGSAMFDLIPHALKLPTRGFCDIQAHRFSSGSVRTVCHEFSHALQSRARNPMIDIHYRAKKDIWLAKWRPYGYTERDEISTFLFQFRTFIPQQLKQMEAKGDRRGWKLFSYATVYPCRITREAFEQALRTKQGK